MAAAVSYTVGYLYCLNCYWISVWPHSQVHPVQLCNLSSHCISCNRLFRLFFAGVTRSSLRWSFLCICINLSTQARSGFAHLTILNLSYNPSTRFFGQGPLFLVVYRTIIQTVRGIKLEPGWWHPSSHPPICGLILPWTFSLSPSLPHLCPPVLSLLLLTLTLSLRIMSLIKTLHLHRSGQRGEG